VPLRYLHGRQRLLLLVCCHMALFCFLWIPLFYLFWRGVSPGSGAGWTWALIAGVVSAAIQFFAAPIVTPAGFGFSRWLSGFVDIVVMPALIPLLVCLLLYFLKVINDPGDFPHFALLWLIPIAAVRSLTWGYIQRDAIVLVLVPILWTAISVGIPFFINLILNNMRPVILALSCLALVFIPFAAATAYWAFFSHQTAIGVILFVVAIAPMLTTASLSFIRSRGG